MPIDLYPNIAKIKRGGAYQNLPGFVQQNGDADIEAMIANSENSTTAQYVHPEGSYFILNDVLYKAIINIAVNDTIAVGTNCEVAVLCNDVSEMESDVDNLKSALTSTESSTVSVIWEQGTLIDNTGAEKTSTTRIRTDDFISVNSTQLLTIIPSNQYLVAVYSWENNTYSGYGDWYQTPIKISGQDGLKIKIIVKHEGGNVITPTVGENISVSVISKLANEANIVKSACLGLLKSGYASKNVLKFKPVSKKINGVDFKVMEDGSVVVNGTATERATFLLLDSEYRKLTGYGLKDGSDYVLVGCPAGGATTTYNLILQNSGSPNITDTGLGSIFTVNGSSQDTYRPAIDVKKNTVCSNVVFYPMVVPLEIYKLSSTYQRHLISNEEIEPNEKIFRQYVPIIDGQHLIIHRGGNFGAPYNTIPAFELCYNLGYSIIEADIQITSDNIPVIIHGDKINSWAKNSDGTDISTDVYVSESTYAELLDYDFGIQYGSVYAETKIPTLKEFLLFCKRRNIVAYLDVNLTSNISTNAQAIYGIVKNTGMIQNTIFDCLTVSNASSFIALDQNLNILVQGATSTANVDSIAELIGSCKRLIANCPAASYSAQLWTQEFVDYIHSKGMKAKATITNVTKQQATSVFNIGTDFIMCDDLIPYELMP